MQVVNIKELKARLSAYLRQVRAGETFLVTDRSTVVARLGPVDAVTGTTGMDLAARLASIGARPPLRDRRPSDYARPGGSAGLATAAIDALLDWSRGDA